MARGRQTLTQRIALDGGEEIKRELEELGLVGQAAFKTLGRAAENVNKPIREIPDVIRQAQRELERIGTQLQRTGRRLRQVGQDFSLFVTAPIVAGFGLAIREAVQFEAAMADVRKVVDFPTPDGLQQLSDQLLEMTKRIPIAAEGLAAIAAAAGQAGVPAEELAEFTELVAQSTVAFGLSAEEAGRSLARIRTALGLTTPDVRLLSDAMNQLANNTATSEAEVLSIVARVSALGEVSGIAAKDIAAIGAAMIATGVESERAATGLRNILLVLSSGKNVTDAQSEAFEQLGLDAGRLATRLQTEGIAVLLDVFERIRAQAPEVRASILEQLFGRRVVDAAAPLINNLDVLRDTLGLVAEEADFAGSTLREFNIRSETAENDLTLLANAARRVGQTFGETLMPPFRAVVEALTRFLNNVADLPGPIRAVIVGLAGLAATVGPLLIALGALIQVIGFSVTGLGRLLPLLTQNAAGVTVLGVAVRRVALAFGFWPTVIFLVVEALSQLWAFIQTMAGFDWAVWVEAFRQAGAAIVEAAQATTDFLRQIWTDFVTWFESTVIGRLIAQIDALIARARSAAAQALGFGSGGAGSGNGNGGAALARGAVGIAGPGTSTSDSIPAQLSAGESVITAQATRSNHDLLEAMNALPRVDFAALLQSLAGGLAGVGAAPLRLAGGGVAVGGGGGASGSVKVDLGLDGQRFDLRSDADVAGSLVRFARTRQRASAGRAPGWVK